MFHQAVCKVAGSQCKGLICAWAGGSVSRKLEMLAHTFHLIQRFALYL